MTVVRRTQSERTAATRGALVAAARSLFTEHGYAGVGTERVAREAGVTRGALYHQFADKAELFAAVVEAVEVDVTAGLVAVVAGLDGRDARTVLVGATDAWLEVSAEPDVRRIILIDGPAVLGWERWREITTRHGFGLVTGMLGELIAAGDVPAQPVEPLAHVLIGALDEAALYVALADDPDRARAEVGAVLHRLLGAIIGATEPAAPAARRRGRGR